MKWRRCTGASDRLRAIGVGTATIAEGAHTNFFGALVCDDCMKRHLTRAGQSQNTARPRTEKPPCPNQPTRGRQGHAVDGTLAGLTPKANKESL